MAKLVYNIEAASPTMISALDRHCRVRVPDGSSNIDPRRSHMNRILVGSEDGLTASMNGFFEGGVKRPAKQSERPFLRIVCSASPEYFRPQDPDEVGTWDDTRLKHWTDATLDHLKQEHGRDLVFVHLHLDEDTPHLHAVVIPTYLKKPRKPGRKKRDETYAEFNARKQGALTAPGVRTAGRASHPTLSKPDSFLQLRKRMAVAVDHLGIEYGEDRQIDAGPGLSTRQWVKKKAAELRRKEAEQKRRDADQQVRSARLDAREKEIEDEKTAQLKILKDQIKAYEDTARTARTDRDTALRERDDAIASLDEVNRQVADAELALSDAQGLVDNIMDDATKTAAEMLENAEAEALRLVREEVEKRTDESAVLRGFRAFVGLLAEGVSAVFGEAGRDRLKAWLDPKWKNHPDNPERPIVAKRERFGSGLSGPGGP